MTTQTAAALPAVKCEANTNGSYRYLCGKPATAYITQGYGVPGSGPIPQCNFHASIERRRKWATSPVLPLDEDVTAVILARVAEQEAREQSERARKQREANARFKVRKQEEWTDYPEPFTSTLVLDHTFAYGAEDERLTVEAHVHPVGKDHHSWGAVRISLENSDVALPYYVRLSSGQTLTPAAAREMADVLRFMADAAEEASAE